MQYIDHLFISPGHPLKVVVMFSRPGNTHESDSVCLCVTLLQLCLGRRSSDRKWYRVRVQEVMTTSHGTKARLVIGVFMLIEVVGCSVMEDQV